MARSGTRKSAGAFRTISEVCRDIDVQQHVLRFWETKFSQIRPLKRGGGRRYYRPEDVKMLKQIQYLLYDEGYTIKGVQKLLKENRGQLQNVVDNLSKAKEGVGSDSIEIADSVGVEALVDDGGDSVIIEERTEIVAEIEVLPQETRDILSDVLGELRDIKGALAA